MSPPFVSIIIPVKEINDFIREAVPKHRSLDYPNFEVLILPDKSQGEDLGSEVRIIPTYPKTGPADKRDIGVRKARGEILAFTDDNAYPRSDWLKNAVRFFEDPQVAAVCGPGITPPSDSTFQRAGGWVSASLLGTGPEACYRFFPGKRREVDDYPSMNLIVRRTDFEAAGGFDSHFWPGEDTKLCLDLTKRLGKKIIYDPEIVVYHHRRPLLIPHLRQFGRYGLHRGHFARILPATSRRLGYIIPALFVLGLLGVPVFSFLLSTGDNQQLTISRWFLFVYSLVLGLYFILLLTTAAWAYSQERDWKVALLVIPGIFLTHVWNGLRFVQGFFSRELKR